ncbi:hypothetical protein MVEN_00957500 [Mycena venus]|uniref:Uncharacterized protein n=1 Tax=Mycena venus TaxID=2733690 RepID=A0A8H7CZS5_9AGAR|nr:hypothetical protein MVEN_00957500 [Mycena venus]
MLPASRTASKRLVGVRPPSFLAARRLCMLRTTEMPSPPTRAMRAAYPPVATARPSSSLAPKSPTFSACDAYEVVWKMTEEETLHPESEEVMMHPILQSVDFLICEYISEAHLFLRGDNYGDRTPLEDAAVARDLASIPAVHNFTISLENYLRLPSVRIEVVNPEGITVLDIFTTLAKAMSQKIETDEGQVSLSEALVDHRFYEGFARVKRTGTSLSAELSLGS